MRKLIAGLLAVLAGVSFGETCTWNGAWDVEPQEGGAIVCPRAFRIFIR